MTAQIGTCNNRLTEMLAKANVEHARLPSNLDDDEFQALAQFKQLVKSEKR